MLWALSDLWKAFVSEVSRYAFYTVLTHLTTNQGVGLITTFMWVQVNSVLDYIEDARNQPHIKRPYAHYEHYEGM
jgi:hypothetical protein